MVEIDNSNVESVIRRKEHDRIIAECIKGSDLALESCLDRDGDYSSDYLVKSNFFTFFALGFRFPKIRIGANEVNVFDRNYKSIAINLAEKLSNHWKTSYTVVNDVGDGLSL